MSKCPRCSAVGNKIKNVRFMNYCRGCPDGTWYDDKGQVYEYTIKGQLQKIGRAGVLTRPTKEDLEGMSLTEITNVYGTSVAAAKAWLIEYGIYEPQNIKAFERKTEEEGFDVTAYEELKAKYPTLEALLLSKEGKSMKEWERENGVNNTYFYKLKKELETETPEEPTPGTTGQQSEEQHKGLTLELDDSDLQPGEETTPAGHVCNCTCQNNSSPYPYFSELTVLEALEKQEELRKELACVEDFLGCVYHQWAPGTKAVLEEHQQACRGKLGQIKEQFGLVKIRIS